jgi:hypothetical protein
VYYADQVRWSRHIGREMGNEAIEVERGHFARSHQAVPEQASDVAPVDDAGVPADYTLNPFETMPGGQPKIMSKGGDLFLTQTYGGGRGSSFKTIESAAAHSDGRDNLKGEGGSGGVGEKVAPQPKLIFGRPEAVYRGFENWAMNGDNNVSVVAKYRNTLGISESKFKSWLGEFARKNPTANLERPDMQLILKLRNHLQISYATDGLRSGANQNFVQQMMDNIGKVSIKNPFLLNSNPSGRRIDLIFWDKTTRSPQLIWLDNRLQPEIVKSGGIKILVPFPDLQELGMIGTIEMAQKGLSLAPRFVYTDETGNHTLWIKDGKLEQPTN